LENLKSFERPMNSRSIPEVAFGAFRLDMRHRRLLKNGAAVLLGERALDVLCALVAADGALVTKPELMAQVWPGVTVEENNLQVQVYALRRALGEDGDSRGYIRTVSGRGYRFAGDASAPSDAKSAAPPAQEIFYCRSPDGVHLALATLGEGSPVVRAPVWMSHLEHDWRTTVWREVLDALAADHQLVRYDSRGMGLSDRNVEISFEAGISDLETVVDALGLKRFALLGISQGAAVSIAYAARHPDRVARLVLSGGYARGALAAAPQRAAAVEAMAILVSEHWGSDNPAFRQLFTSLGFPDASAAQIRELNELQRVSVTGDTAARIMKMLAHVDVSERLAQVRAPTLVLHRRDDAWIPAERSREIARGIAGARFHEIAGANHVVLPQEPLFDSYIATVLAFLAPG
jgi:pimeloyl-ACP methyl ester carboxylesterase/DNA-binding winged helix-turn-helix (wHTH) protein